MSVKRESIKASDFTTACLTFFRDQAAEAGIMKPQTKPKLTKLGKQILAGLHAGWRFGKAK